MAIIQIICVLLGFSYLFLMLAYRQGWLMQQTFTVPDSFTPTTFISIIIPARNEEQNIGACISSILGQSYPSDLYEIIVVDDHSEDNTSQVVKAFGLDHVQCISLAEFLEAKKDIVAYKKLAINTGIEHSSGELIVTTDADCIVPANWLRTIAAKYTEEKPVMIVGPVDFTCNNTVVQIFQSLDFMSMQGITSAAHKLQLGNMSNGANLCFTRAAFTAVNGYKDIDHLASGDDYLLMMKFSKTYPDRIAYLKSTEAIVKTPPQPNWGSFLQQRIRWASKSAKYDDKKLNSILIFAYIFNVTFLFLLVGSLFYARLWPIAAALFTLKVLLDFLFLYPVSAFFNKRRQLPLFFFLQPVHIAYIILAGLLGFVGVYTWKGRRVK
jgi:cellulose synthase/poly-beta-1,6-N-acetylglucosamine synthase-like glycosyltransferase